MSPKTNNEVEQLKSNQPGLSEVETKQMDEILEKNQIINNFSDNYRDSDN